ncbi:MAG TPA: protein translocase subunit SecD [Woeseiaceae bacterium]|nr:protein translocase subunit SecD [Woeseiaceae bacterium]
MNKYPAWLNALLVLVLLVGALFALPNIYGSAPAVQIVAPKVGSIDASQLEEFERVVDNAGIEPEAAYLLDGRAVIRFTSHNDQVSASTLLRENYGREFGIANTVAPRMPDWLRSLGLNPMSLGLDLRGGVYVLLEVDMETAVNKRLELYEENFSDLLRDARIRNRVELDAGAITVRVTDAKDLDAARKIIRAADSDVIIIDGSDGRSLRVRMTDEQIKARQDLAIEQNVTTLRNRVNELGVAEPIVQRQGADRIVVQLPGVEDPTELDKILTATATLEFRLVDQSGNEPGSRTYPGRGGEASQVLKRKIIASGDQIIDASAGFSEGQPAVSIKLDAAGGESMLETTQNNLQKPMSTLFIETNRETVIRDGEPQTRTVKTEEIINTATIRGVFKNNFQITGLTPGEARDLALLLRAGALAAPVYKIDDRTIGPSLGADNIKRGYEAIVIGFVAVIVFMAIYYRGFGLIADLALFSNLIFIVALLSLLQASLTLPGIAGIVLTVGMAVDANVLIFERIREELAAGVGPQAAINSGYEKAFSSIADANITTLIAAIVLFAFGSGPVKGFAITLSLGIVTSMFTSIVGTRAIVNVLFGGRRIESLPV